MNNVIYLDLPEYSPRKSFLNLDLCDEKDNYPEQVFSMEKLYQTTENEINIEGEMNYFITNTSARGSGDKFITN